MALESQQELTRGDEAPTFELRGTDGETYTLDSFADSEALLLVFTCNHCPYAKAKYEAMNEIAADYDEVAVVGINANDAEQYPEDSFEEMQARVEDGTIRFDAYLHDETQEAAKAYGAVCTPDPFLFAHDGDETDATSAEVKASDEDWHLVYHGRFDDATSPDEEPSGEPGFEMREAIDAVLAGEEVGVDFRPSRGCSIKWKAD